MAALFANPHTAAGQARIIENNNKAFLRNFIEIHDFTHTFAAEVHKGLRLYEKHPLIANHAIPNQCSVFVFFHLNLIFFRQLINYTEADIMLCFGVFSAGVAKTHDAVKLLPSRFLIFKSVKKTHVPFLLSVNTTKCPNQKIRAAVLRCVPIRKLSAFQNARFLIRAHLYSVHFSESL
jgi:hypothetical protein